MLISVMLIKIKHVFSSTYPKKIFYLYEKKTKKDTLKACSLIFYK